MRHLAFLLCVLVVAAGCGGGARHASRTPRIPAGLARAWAQRAEAIATAADSGDSCGAARLAQSLQQQVIDRESSVPLRYRGILLRAANRLANGIVCTPATVTTIVTTKPPHPPHPHPHPHPPPPHPPHDHHGHGHGPPGPGDGGPGGGGG